MVLGIKPTVDIVFKAVFGNPERTGITLDFVNAILEQTGRRQAASLVIVNPTLPGRFHAEKDIIVDIHARDNEEREFQIEIQVRPYAAMPRRMLQNWSRCYLSRLRKGMGYEELRPVVSIWILEHDAFRDGTWLHDFAFRDRLTGLELGEDAIILVVELPAWARERGDLSGCGIVTELDRWLYYLWRGDEIDAAALPRWIAETPVEEAVEAMATFTKSEAARDAYWRRLEFQMEQKSIKVEAQREGRAEGLAEGRTEGCTEGRADEKREIAARMKGRGLDSRQIAELTGLSEEEIAAL